MNILNIRLRNRTLAEELYREINKCTCEECSNGISVEDIEETVEEYQNQLDTEEVLYEE